MELDAAVFDAAEAEAEEPVTVDDTPDDVASARAFGWKAEDAAASASSAR